MKKDDSKKEVLPFSSKKKPSREGTVRRCKTLHQAEKRFTNVCSYLSFDLNRFLPYRFRLSGLDSPAGRL